MKLSKMALACAVAGLLSAGTAYAQHGPGYPSSVQRTAFEYNSYYAQDYDERAGAKERGVEGTPDPQAQAPAADGGEEEKSFGNGAGTILNPCCDLGEQWKLFDSPCLDCHNIVVAGWLTQSFTWNTTNPSDRFNGPVTFTDRANEYQMNQLYLYAERATDTGGCGWDLGGRVDLLYGTDARFTQAAGLDNEWMSGRFYGLAMPQVYLEVAYNDLKVKLGHFYAPVGYEVVPSTGNFFPNLPYTFQYGEAFTMSGLLATWQYSEDVAIGGGVYQGWDNFFDDAANPFANFVITYAETFSDGASFAYSGTIGNEPNQNASGFSTRYVQTLVYSRTLSAISDRLDYVAQSDFGFQNNALANGDDAHWYGLNQYLFYKVSDCMSYGVRAEWFRDEEGYRVGGFLPDNRGLSPNRSGYPGSFYELTFGANWKYSANTTIRPYVRFDWFSGSSPAPDLRPFDGGNGNSQTLIGFDLITLF